MTHGKQGTWASYSSMYRQLPTVEEKQFNVVFKGRPVIKHTTPTPSQEPIWLHHTNTSYSPRGISQDYKLETNYYIMQVDLVINLFSRLSPQTTHFCRSVLSKKKTL